MSLGASWLLSYDCDHDPAFSLRGVLRARRLSLLHPEVDPCRDQREPRSQEDDQASKTAEQDPASAEEIAPARGGLRLSVYTPTFQRPGLLADCVASVEAQTVPVEHIIVHDRVGLGVGGMFADIPNHADRATGDLVMVLSDDNLLVDPQVAEDLLRVWDGQGRPDVVMFKGSIGECVQPLAWDQEPVERQVDLSCFALAREIWQRHAGDWGHRYEGDFDFIHTLWENGYRFYWWNRLCFMAQQISQGRPEAVAA